MNRSNWLKSLILLLVVLGFLAGLAGWKYSTVRQAIAASANQPEPMESIGVATVKAREHRRTTTSIGTVLALRSVTLRNELAGTVRKVALMPGEIVEAGTVLVALDVSVEEAELKAQQAEAALAETTLERMQRLIESRATSETDVDRARAERDVAVAQTARTKAIIERKTIRAPFRGRVGLADIHVGQYLAEGALLTTLQGIDEDAHVDFAVPQRVAAGLRENDIVEVLAMTDATPVPAKIVAVDARVDPATRNAMIRARIQGPNLAAAPGASVRVRTPIGPPEKAAAIPVSALRKGPTGDHVFVIAPDKSGKTRAQLRPVQSGPMLGDEVLIYKGLEPGEQIAATGSFKLREGVLVAIGNAAPGAPANTAQN